MNGTTFGAIAVGAVVLGLSLLGARHPTIHPTEQRVFRAVNGLPDWLYWPLWLPMQLGNLVVGTAAGLVLAFGYLAMTREGQWLSFLRAGDNPTLILIIAYATRRLPYVVRSAAAGYQQTSVSL